MSFLPSHNIQPFSMAKGQIQVIFGPMFSGKTTELIRRLKRYQIANYNCLIIRYANDERYSSNGIATHDKQSMAAISASKLRELKVNQMEYDVIGIDEGQFFCDIVGYAEEMANLGKIVIVAALDGTFQRVGFGDILNLVPLAENVVKLNAVCMSCFSDASYTKRIGNEKQVEIIGGTDKYMAVCRECHFSPVSKKSSPNKRSPFRPLGEENNVSPPKRQLFEEKVAVESLNVKS